MSSYLRRLGARALGGAPDVHPAARLMPIFPVSARAALASRAFAEAQIEEPNHSAFHTAPTDESAVDSAATARFVAHSASDIAGARASPPAAKNSIEPPPRHATAALMPRPPSPALPSRANKHRSPRDEPVGPSVAAPVDATEFARKAQPDTTEAVRPILPARRAPHHSAERSPARERLALRDDNAARANRHATQPPDVHIHIGRVELTAVMPPAAPRRETAGNAKKPLSLDEYLRLRDGKAP